MRRRLSAWFLSKLPRTDIGNGVGDVFFWRYQILKTRLCSVFLHEFLRSDSDRCLHDHPWPFVSIILREGYFEQMHDGMHWRPVGSILVRRAKAAHRIEISQNDRRPWSLVIVGPKVRKWGFYTLNGWEVWKPGKSPVCETGPEASQDARGGAI